ncbi:MAG: UvrABC system protein C [Candidatus Izimaplasma bacterium HR2]|nr:MAG: UvrABC system protein C [Candidatus Izimaplasma bacterium HR2]
MFKEKIATIPELPGSYQFKNKDGVIIYVGKAKNLKKRVASYFTGSHNAKTSRLVMNINDIEYIITHSELDALLLELNLIKKFNPRYNIMLTDDKTYPYIEVTTEKHPKLIVTRNITKKSRVLFGPYPNVRAARETVKLLNNIYPLRKCIRLPKEACLYYHMGQCLAPCIKQVTIDDYEQIIKSIKKFLKGDTKDVIKSIEEKMHIASDLMEYEKASEYKKVIDSIKTTTNKQKINLSDLKDRDIIGYYYNEYLLSMEIFFIRNGKISARHQELFEYYSEPLKSVEDFIAQFYEKNIVPKEIFVPFELDSETLSKYLNTKIVKPQKGDKEKLLKLAIINAKESLIQKTEIVKRELDRTINSIDKLGNLLDLPTPYVIEAFDNSNLFGTDAVSSMVVFINGKPSKKDYRKFRIKSLDNKASDYHTMKEVIYRRYYKVLMENLRKPDLLLVDGGIQQINAAKEILDSLDLNIPIAGIVKDNNHSTNHILNGNLDKIEIDKKSDVFHLITRIQDEAHRFAINYHRQIRGKGIFNSILDEIEGIGPKTKEKLLKKYKSVNLIKFASIKELTSLGINEKIALNLIEKLKEN